MRATLDLAKEMGSGIARQQEARKMRGAVLFQEYKKKMGMVQPEAAATPRRPPASASRNARRYRRNKPPSGNGQHWSIRADNES